MTDEVLERLLFPKEKSATNKRMPDYAYIRKELLRNGVSKKLLWSEYCEECRLSGEEPLMYSQFCYYIQQDEQKRRSTMHIPRKPSIVRLQSILLKTPDDIYKKPFYHLGIYFQETFLLFKHLPDMYQVYWD